MKLDLHLAVLREHSQLLLRGVHTQVLDHLPVLLGHIVIHGELVNQMVLRQKQLYLLLRLDVLVELLRYQHRIVPIHLLQNVTHE